MARRVCLSALLLLACVDMGAAQSPKIWRHGVIEPKSDAGFVMTASRRDFGERFGLKIETLALKNGQIAIKALLAGELDSVESGAGEAIVAGAAGADVKIIGCNWPGLPHAVFVKSNIADVQGLKGKTIAASAPGSLPDLLVRSLLEKSGVPIADVRIASLGGDLERYKALSAGVVDAAVISSEYLPIAPKTMKLLLAGRELIPNFMRLCLDVAGKTVRERPEDAARFLATQIAAGRYAVGHRAETVALTREVTGAKPDDPRPEFVFDETVKKRDFDPEVPIPMDKLTWMQDQLVKTGNVRKPMDLSKLVAPEVRAAALRLAGDGGKTTENR
jgi:NitT/TauT family transport system substrate-binding protein